MKTETIGYRWVEARYKGDMARYIKGLSDSGIGYIELEYGVEGRQSYIKAALPYVSDGAIPDHLIEITNEGHIKKLEKKRCNRNGTHKLEAKGFCAICFQR